MTTVLSLDDDDDSYFNAFCPSEAPFDWISFGFLDDKDVI